VRHMHGTDNLDRTQDRIGSSGFPGRMISVRIGMHIMPFTLQAASRTVFYISGTFGGIISE